MSFHAILHTPFFRWSGMDISLYFIVLMVGTFLLCWGVVVLFSFSRALARPKRNTVLIVGTQGVGKTWLYANLLTSGAWGKSSGKMSSIRTVTSLKPNSSVVPLASSGCSLKLVDLPGSAKLRALWIDYLPSTLGMMYVIHADTLTPSELRSHSDYLFALFARWKQPRAAFVFVVRASSQAPSLEFVQNSLNDELRKVIQLKRSSLNALDAEEWRQNASNSSALSNELFDLSAMSEYELDVECDSVESALPLDQYSWRRLEPHQADLSEIQDWMMQLP